MSHTGIETNLRISAGLDYVAASGDGEDVRAHYLWMVQQITRDVPLEKLTTSEIVSLVAVLIPAHSRVLGRDVGGPPGRLLKLIPPSGDVASG